MLSITKMFSEPWIVTFVIIVVATILWYTLQARKPRGVRLAVVTRTPIRNDLLLEPADRTARPRPAPPQQSPSVLQDTIAFPARPFNPPEVSQPGWMARWTGSSWTESQNFLNPNSRPLTFEGQYREPLHDPNFPFGGYRPTTPPLESLSFPSNPRTEAWLDDLPNSLPPPSDPLQLVGMTDSVGSPLQLGGRGLLQQSPQTGPMAIALLPGVSDPFALSLPSPVLTAPSSPRASIPDVLMLDTPVSPVSQPTSQSDDGVSVHSHDAAGDFAWSA